MNKVNEMEFLKVNSYKELSQKAADIVVKVVQENPHAVLGLATGSTPVGLYENLVQAYQSGRIDFHKVKTFNLDEYVGIHQGHPQSYHQYMQKHLFQYINLKQNHVHIPDGETGDLEEECQRYERLLAKEGPIDLQILGLGINGHIGFNEPGTAFDARTHVVNLTDSTREANAKFFDAKEEVPKQAITMGIGNIMESREIILLAFGEHKQPAIKQLMEGEVYEDFPASALLQHDRVKVIYGEKDS